MKNVPHLLGSLQMPRWRVEHGFFSGWGLAAKDQHCCRLSRRMMLPRTCLLRCTSGWSTTDLTTMR